MSIFETNTPYEPITFEKLAKNIILERERNNSWVLAPIVITKGISHDFYDHHMEKKKIINVFHALLVDNWLFNDKMYDHLLPYFIVNHKGEQIYVEPIHNIHKLDKIHKNDKAKMLVDWYIEKNYVNDLTVKHILRQFMLIHGLQWHDLYRHQDAVREFMYETLKKLIIESIASGHVMSGGTCSTGGCNCDMSSSQEAGTTGIIP